MTNAILHEEPEALRSQTRPTETPHDGEQILHVSYTPKIAGTVAASPSKSYTHRAIIVASMGGGKTRIDSPLFCKDTEKTVRTWKALGAKIAVDEANEQLQIEGFNGHPRVNESELNVGESGTLLRFVLPMLALAEGRFTVNGLGSLRERPNREIVNTLASWGVEIAGQGLDHRVPVLLTGSGKLMGGEATIGGRTSSQVISALLMAAPKAQNDTVLTVEGGLVSRPYVDITIDVLKWAGVAVELNANYSKFRVRAGQQFTPQPVYRVPGDYSSAAFLLVAAAILDSEITVTGLRGCAQGDKKIVSILQQMGAEIETGPDSVHVKGCKELKGIEIDCADIPDLGPILTTLGCFAKGTTRIHNAGHLKYKESNRLLEPAGQLGRLGADITSLEKEGEIIIRYCADKLHGGTVDACNDHRIAMSLAVAGLRIREGVTIERFEAVAKSYPKFVAHMKQLNAKVTLETAH